MSSRKEIYVLLKSEDYHEMQANKFENFVEMVKFLEKEIQ